jgi:hypothetical protein
MTISINSSDIARLKHLVTEGVRVKQEVEDLNEGLKETVKAIAEELEIKPKLLNKVITIAHKGNLHVHTDELEDIEAILTATGAKIV